MKSLKYFLTALCLVAVVFAVCACDIPSNGVVGLDGIGNMLKNDYKQTKLVVDTTEGGVKLSDTFLVTKGEDKISVAVKLQRLATFEQDDNGNIVVPSKQIKETIGSFDVVDGKVVNASQGLDVSELPALLAAYAYGPVSGIAVCLIKNLIKLPSTSTAAVGELFNFAMGALFVGVAGFVYKRHKSRKTAILGAIAGAAVMAVFSVPSNYFVVYPAYVQFYHMPLEAILGMYQAILPSADSLIKCLVIFNMPFTLVKGLLDAVLCMLIYKPLSPILHGRR